VAKTQSGWTSKTNILGALQLIVGIITAIAGSQLIADHPTWVSGLIAVNGIVTMVIRQLTSLPITWGDK
jgi:hypothetical protein